MVLPNQTHSQVSWDSIFQVPLVFKLHGIPRFPEIQFEIPWEFHWIPPLEIWSSKESMTWCINTLAVWVILLEATPGLVVSDITREWKWSPWRDPRSSAAYWGAEWWGNGNAPCLLSLLCLSSCWFLMFFSVYYVLLCSATVYNVWLL